MATSGLSKQDLNTLDVTKLTPLTPDVISRQATINIGTIGHVAHGKSTVVKAISGVQTVRFKHEKERNITIKLGYANAKLYKCESGKCEPPAAYFSFGSSMEDSPCCQKCSAPLLLKRHVSFVDCPGHDILMATMLNGAAVMDAALLLIAGNETCPQPQTLEHLAAVEIMRLQHLIVLQNKVELINEGQADAQYKEITSFLTGTIAAKAPVVPVSAVFKYNIDAVVEYLCTHIPVPIRDFTSRPEMIIIRSFDVNKPGDDVENLKGGVAGGSILKGVLRMGDEIEVRPGVVRKTADGKHTCEPIRTKIVSLYTENNELEYAVPGGLIGVGTLMDPTLTRSDRLVGQVLGHPGHLPDVYIEIHISFYLLRRLLGVKTEIQETDDDGKQRKTKVPHLQKGEFLMVNVGSTSAGGRVIAAKKETSTAKVELSQPVCARAGDKIALSRKVEKHWRLIGWGQITSGNVLKLP